MKREKSIIAIIIALGLVFTTVSYVVAQRPNRQQMQRRQFDPEEMLARSLERIMEEMNMSEDEAAILKPMIENIMKTRMEQAQKRREAVQALND
ncbi:hypothetical protein GF312_08675, partial [Candidatus Poribacteria bacterium]|nr:hypothetical protein [Candidatus Poribacteria bacterium]